MKSSINVQSWIPSDVLSTTIEEDQEQPSVSELDRIMWIFGNAGKGETTSQKNVSGLRKLHDDDFSSWMPVDISNLQEIESESEEQASNQALDAFDAAKVVIPARPVQHENRTPVAGDQDNIVEDAYLQAEKIVALRLAEAKKEADEMIQKAILQRDEIIQKAYEEGYAKGVNDIEMAVHASREMVDNFYSWRQEMLENSEQDIIGLVKEVANGLFGEGFVLDAELLQNTFSQVLLTARSLGEIRLYVNPDDAKLLDPAWREYQVLISGQRIQILPTEVIRRGGCYIEGQRGSVDARVESQLRALLDDGLSFEDEVSNEEGED